MKKNALTTVLLVIVCAFAGLLIGKGAAMVISRNQAIHANVPKGSVSLNKLDALINLVSSRYVEDVDEKAIIEKLMPQVVHELDPHSVYISAEEMTKTNEEMEGSFSGVGIQFNIREDTVRVIAVVNGGPAERAGLKAGDCIVTVADSAFTGKRINNDLVMKTLRGEKKSSIQVGVKRYGTDDILPYTLVRDDIPMNSVDCSYRIDDHIAYLKIGSFTRTTYNEFVNIVNKLCRHDACDRLIIDLRGNPGGLMNSALLILNELLPRNSLMLYVEGRAYPRENNYSDGSGSFQNLPVVVLMDEWSASASEIVAGAIQDNDRGYVVGRRSYGKGLVQQQIPFRDGSAVRLTVAHYYIPSGRCVQKPYTKGDFEDYEMDLYKRYERGEFNSADSIRMNDSLRFTTVHGRTVYGGGGIMPDCFVPLDTTSLGEWYTQVVNKNLFYLFAARYADRHRQGLEACQTPQALVAHLDRQDWKEQFLSYVRSQGIKGSSKDIAMAMEELQTQIYAYIARNTLGEDAFWQLLQEKDPTLLKAVEMCEGLGTLVK